MLMRVETPIKLPPARLKPGARFKSHCGATTPQQHWCIYPCYGSLDVTTLRQLRCHYNTTAPMPPHHDSTDVTTPWQPRCRYTTTTSMPLKPRHSAQKILAWTVGLGPIGMPSNTERYGLEFQFIMCNRVKRCFTKMRRLLIYPLGRSGWWLQSWMANWATTFSAPSLASL